MFRQKTLPEKSVGSKGEASVGDVYIVCIIILKKMTSCGMKTVSMRSIIFNNSNPYHSFFKFLFIVLFIASFAFVLQGHRTKPIPLFFCI